MNDAYECMHLEVEELEEKDLQARAKRALFKSSSSSIASPTYQQF